jgi:hypothetical protein
VKGRRFLDDVGSELLVPMDSPIIRTTPACSGGKHAILGSSIDAAIEEPLPADRGVTQIVEKP